MDVNRLLSDDLDFELKRRGISNEGTVDDKRAKLRARMRVEREVNVSFPKLVIDTQEQLQICNTKLVDLEGEIVSSGQPMAQNEYKRIKSRLIHVYNRLEVVSQPDNESLVEKCLQLLDCLDQKCQIAVPENPAVVSEDPVPLPEPVSHEEDTPVMPSWREQMRRFSTWESTRVTNNETPRPFNTLAINKWNFKMEVKLDVDRLLRDELEYELQIRRIDYSGNVEKLRKTLRSALALEKSGNVFSQIIQLDAKTEITICEQKLKELKDILFTTESSTWPIKRFNFVLSSKMEFKLDVDRLLRDELEYELQIRRIDYSGNVEKLRKTLRSALALEKSGNVFSQIIQLDAKTEITICEQKLKELKDILFTTESSTWPIKRFN
ncbi:hypothetical protein RN001_003326, partial [Aquatica leii]